MLLEPVMKIEVIAPDESAGDVIGRPEWPARPDRGHGAAARRDAGHSEGMCPWQRCLAMRPICAR